MDYSAKMFLLPLIVHLPPIQSREVIERISEMNSPIPLIFPLPLSITTKLLDEMERSVMNFSSLRRLIVPNIPFLLSCGTLESQGKSSFLNLAFQTNFEVNSSDAFHPGTVDVTLHRSRAPIMYNILDSHGIVPDSILKLMASICSMVFFHIMPSDVKASVSSLFAQMEIFKNVKRIILLVRDSSYEDGTKLLERLQSYDQWRDLQQHVEVRLLYVPRIKDGAQFKLRFKQYIRSHLKPALELIRPIPTNEENEPAFYLEYEGALRATLSKELHNSMLSKDHNPMSLQIQSEMTRTLSVELLAMLYQVECNEDHQRLLQALFPLAHLHCRVEDVKLRRLISSCDSESENERETRVTLMEKEIRECLDQMEKVQIHPLVEKFIQVILTNEMALYDEFSNVLLEFSQFTTLRDIHNKRERRLEDLPVSIEWFWREILQMQSPNIMLLGKSTEFLGELREKISLMSQTILQAGRPLEILNGDSLSINTQYLTEVLKHFASKQLFVCSILGPQSSAKSTLLNYLFGSDFQVSAGRCTKGMYASIFSTEYEGADNLLVLDTEGLLSIEKKDTLFDKQMTLLALAMSHVVLINIKGEMGTEMKNLLEVTLLGLKRLRVRFPQPKLFFILRDMVDLDKAKQQNTIRSIQKDILDVAKNMEFEFDEINEESFILLPSAFSHENHDADLVSGPSYVRNDIFSTKIAEMRAFILNNAHMMSTHTQSPNKAIFTNADQWVSHVNAVWQSVQQYGDFLNFKTLKEYYDRNDLGRILQEIITDILDGEMVSEARVFQNLNLNLEEDGVEMHMEELHLTKAKETTDGYIETVLLPRYYEKVMHLFAQRIKDLRLTEGLKEEYNQTLKNVWKKMGDYISQETENKVSRGLVQVAIGDAINKIRSWIDTIITEQQNNQSEATLTSQFEAMWASAKLQLQQKLQKYCPEVSKIQLDLRKDFSMVFKANPGLMVILNVLQPERLEELKLFNITSSISPILHEGLKSYITSTSIKNLYRSMTGNESVLQQSWWVILQKVSTYLKNLHSGDKIHFWSSSTVQQEIIKFDNFVKNLDEDILQRLKYTFSPRFYGLCFGELFNVLVHVLLEQHRQYFNESMNGFEQNCQNLQDAFIGLMKSRYDDTKTSSYIASLFVTAISQSVTESFMDEYRVRIKEATTITTKELISKCEQSQKEQEIFDYVTDMANFMKSIFDQHFKEQVSSNVQGYFTGEYATRVSKEIKEISDSIYLWSDICKESLGIQRTYTWANDPTTKSQLSRGFYQFFLNYMRGHISEQFLTEHADIIALLSSQQASICSTRSFQYLFAAVPTQVAIGDPNAFAQGLIKKLFELKQSIMTFPQMTLLDHEIYNQIWERASGCHQLCPFCRAKCTDPNPGHIKHSTDAHRLTAFAGCSVYGTNSFHFDICTSLMIHSHEWAKALQEPPEFRPFDEHIQRYYPDWTIPICDNAEVNLVNKRRWYIVRKKLCKHYDLQDNTPDEWKTIFEGCCPVCQYNFGNSQCGPKRHTQCGHEVGSFCLARLMNRPVREHKCPVCRCSLR